MNKPTLASLLSALAMSAAAQTAPPAETVRVPATAPRFALPDQPYRMSEAELYTLKGDYDLSNGKTLYVFSHGYALYAQVNNEARHRIVPASANTFVGTDRQLKLVLNQHDDGSIDGALTMVVPASQIGGVSTGEQLVVATFR